MELFRHAYIVGIGGIGTSGIALLLRDLNLPVSGSDLRESDITQQLQARGVDIFYQPNPECVKSASCLIIPSFLPSDHPELVTAKNHSIPILNRTQALADFAHCFVQKLTICCGSLKRTQNAMHLARNLSPDTGWCVGAILRNFSLPHAHFGRQMVIDVDERDFYYDSSLYLAFSHADVVISGWFDPDFGYYPQGFTQKQLIDNFQKNACRILQSDDLPALKNSDESHQFVGWFEPISQNPRHRHDIRMHPASVYASLQRLSSISCGLPVRLAVRPFISTLHTYSAEIWAHALQIAREIILIIPPYEGCSTTECFDFAKQLRAYGLNVQCFSLQEARNYASSNDYWLWNGAPDLAE